MKRICSLLLTILLFSFLPAAGFAKESRILVAVFSATDNTRSVAMHIVDALNADLFQIQPQVLYSSADLNWRDPSSRASRENNNPSSRPVISGVVKDMGKYDIVFLGYPIWWREAPRIISTFLESYDFSGKTIVPFCTSGSSGIGSSATNLHIQTSASTTWLSGLRFAGNVSRSAIVTWINGLGLGIKAE